MHRKIVIEFWNKGGFYGRIWDQAAPSVDLWRTHRNINMIKLLLNNGADVNGLDNKGRTYLHSVACSGEIEIAKLLLRYGANIHARDKDGKTPLDMGISYGQIHMIEFLKGTLQYGN